MEHGNNMETTIGYFSKVECLQTSLGDHYEEMANVYLASCFGELRVALGATGARHNRWVDVVEIMKWHKKIEKLWQVWVCTDLLQQTLRVILKINTHYCWKTLFEPKLHRHNPSLGSMPENYMCFASETTISNTSPDPATWCSGANQGITRITLCPCLPRMEMRYLFNHKNFMKIKKKHGKKGCKSCQPFPNLIIVVKCAATSGSFPCFPLRPCHIKTA